MRWLLRLLAPLADWIAGFHLRVGEPILRPEDYRRVLALLQPGDVVLSREALRPTNLLIKGRMKHGAMFVGTAGGEVDGMVEATYPEARYTNLVAVWQYASDVVVLRPEFTDQAGAMDAATAARGFVGTPYDTAFSHGEEALYCSELIVSAYGHPIELRRLRSSHLGVDGVILPDALRTSGAFRVIWDSRA